MSDSLEGGLGLADFISALREELAVAQRRAGDSSDPLRMAVGPVELELDVAYTTERSGEASAGVRAKFWVLEFGEAGVKGTVSSQHARTQHLKVTLTPRLQWDEVDQQGHTTTRTAPVDVESGMGASEDGAQAALPPTPGP